MCGIAGFIGNSRWSGESDTTWLDGVVEDMERFLNASGSPESLSNLLDALAGRFDELMSFGLHLELVEERRALQQIRRLIELLDLALQRIERSTVEEGPSELLEVIAEELRDCIWQLREEVLGNAEGARDLLPSSTVREPVPRSRRFTAWAVQQVMENLGRLEVRGRDSAGLSILCVVSKDRETGPELFEGMPPAADPIIESINGVEQRCYRAEPRAGETVFTFVYKVANLVGRLGDNTAALRRAVRSDARLWRVADLTEQVNVLAHTRWASNGIISLANSHPADGSLLGGDLDQTSRDRGVQFVLNGDVDNYQWLLERVVHQPGYAIDPLVTTDAKILPMVYRLGTNPDRPPEERFAETMRTCKGSLAVVMQHPLYPRTLFLGQKGSGQSLFVGNLKDGFITASEVYGLASLTRRSYSLAGTLKGGMCTALTADGDFDKDHVGYHLDDGEPAEIKPERIYIHSRDIYRGAYDYYFEKEIHEAPSSVRKTIKGKYRKSEGKIDFAAGMGTTLGRLMDRFCDPGLPPIRRIMVIGQGTAAVAAKGTAFLISGALEGSGIFVSSCKASEMSGFLSDQPLDDMLLIAISQSGTTTDTNRTVDVAGSRGAWIHSIVNRRNSPLVSKSDSHFYTSDGRDVEMAVASTKAFYSQIAAGKLTALLLASELKTLSDERIYTEMEDLERLPSDIDWVLAQRDDIKEIAQKYGPRSRNWAVVGNGSNKIAADEIRIKLSELCYKSIPCDHTEDKKHIDLSTEPLTLVVANDLPEQIVQDTVKEVAIFRAHYGKPLVFCARGETRFREQAERVIELPRTGSGLGFVPATVAGHLWGFYAALGIDAGAEKLRRVRGELSKIMENPSVPEVKDLETKFTNIIEYLASGEMDASLPASTVGLLAAYTARLGRGFTDAHHGKQVIREGISILNKAIEELTRPIDTIRHQAKTVTVGISRPQEILPERMMKALEALSASPAQIREMDRRMLRSLSPVVADITGGIFYSLVMTVDGIPADHKNGPWLQIRARFGSSVGKPSRFDRPAQAMGSKRTALRLGRAVWSSGRLGRENLLVIPLTDEDADRAGGVVLFHLDFVAAASRDKKLEILKALGNRYHELVERFQEISGSNALDDFLEDVSPRDLVLEPIDGLILSKTGGDPVSGQSPEE
ncbi:MAG: SIS domain-containing protein [Pseudomonadota bacterium]